MAKRNAAVRLLFQEQLQLVSSPGWVKMPWKGEEKGEALFLMVDWNEVCMNVNAFRKGVGAFVYQMLKVSFGKYWSKYCNIYLSIYYYIYIISIYIYNIYIISILYLSIYYLLGLTPIHVFQLFKFKLYFEQPNSVLFFFFLSFLNEIFSKKKLVHFRNQLSQSVLVPAVI